MEDRLDKLTIEFKQRKNEIMEEELKSFKDDLTQFFKDFKDKKQRECYSYVGQTMILLGCSTDEMQKKYREILGLLVYEEEDSLPTQVWEVGDELANLVDSLILLNKKKK